MPGSKLRLYTLPVRLRWRVRHAAAVRDSAENVIVAVAPDAHGPTGFGEACPRSYVTGETTATVAHFLQQEGPALVERVTSVAELQAWIVAYGTKIDDAPAAFAALETALLDRMGRVDGCSFEQLLGFPDLRQPVRYSAVLADSMLPAFTLQALAYRLFGMPDLKIKLSPHPRKDEVKLSVLARLFGRGIRIRADANNLWRDPDRVVAHLTPLKDRLWAVEEPLAPGDLEGCREVARRLGLRIILDESICREPQLQALRRDPHTWVVNLRVSKMGGILRSLQMARRAATLGIPVIVGAHVGETSLLTRAALTVGGGLRHSPLAREGGFGAWLLARDVAEPSLRFGRHGRLDPACFGLAEQSVDGLTMMPERLARLC